MRILHTSDWHVGRRLKGIQRLDEMQAVLSHLGDFVARASIDLVLHTGDLFDGRSPPAEAERLVNEFFVCIGQAGARMVVIAGNHDDALQLDARSLLAEYANVELVGRPRRAELGGTRILETRGGEKAVVAALPFAGPGAWVSALELAGEEASARSKYALMFQRAVQNLVQPFRADAVNLLMAHTHLEGAAFGGSERRVHLGEDWAATPQTLPSTASYIALGHIHKPQKLAGTLPAYYAGSPLQMDFGEAGQCKTFVVVTASPGRPATVEHVPYEGGLPLCDLRATLAEIAATAEQYRDNCWLRVTVPLVDRDPDINRKVRDLLPKALVVRAELRDAEPQLLDRRDERASPLEHYTAYCLRERQESPEPAALEVFQQLYTAATAVED